MIHEKKNRFRPRFKKLVNSKIVIHNKQKILQFKRPKWDRQKSQFLRLNTNRKRNCYYKFYDQRSHNVPRFMNRFANKYKQNLRSKRRFQLFYGYLSKSYIRSVLSRCILEQNIDKNKSDLKYFLIEKLESRLDIVLVRSYFAYNLRSAHQFISHGHVLVNGLPVKSNSFEVSGGDKIEFSQDIHSLIEYRLGNSILWPLPPKYLQISYRIFQVIVLEEIFFANLGGSLPTKLDVNVMLNSYSR